MGISVSIKKLIPFITSLFILILTKAVFSASQYAYIKEFKKNSEIPNLLSDKVQNSFKIKIQDYVNIRPLDNNDVIKLIKLSECIESNGDKSIDSCKKTMRININIKYLFTGEIIKNEDGSFNINVNRIDCIDNVSVSQNDVIPFKKYLDSKYIQDAMKRIADRLSQINDINCRGICLEAFQVVPIYSLINAYTQKKNRFWTTGVNALQIGFIIAGGCFYYQSYSSNKKATNAAKNGNSNQHYKFLQNCINNQEIATWSFVGLGCITAINAIYISVDIKYRMKKNENYIFSRR